MAIWNGEAWVDTSKVDKPPVKRTVNRKTEPKKETTNEQPKEGGESE